uniref:Uncharacterized protein n=1 Tax=Fagus sylvatica TaxID=28930 RepID=A0A2N9HWQ6_FAGSY
MEQSISKKSWCRFALLLLIIMSLKVHLSTASDTLYPGQRGWIKEDGSETGVSLFATQTTVFSAILLYHMPTVSDAVERWTLSDMMMRRSRAKRHHDFLLMLCSMLCLHLLNLVRLLVSAGFGAFAISRSSDEVEADTKWCDGAVGKSSLTASSSHGRFDNVMKTSVEHTCTREIDECPRFDLVLRKIS